MLVIAVILVATGVAGVGFIFAAVMCTAIDGDDDGRDVLR